MTVVNKLPQIISEAGGLDQPGNRFVSFRACGRGEAVCAREGRFVSVAGACELNISYCSASASPLWTGAQDPPL